MDSWDNRSIRVAIAQIQSLVDGFVDDRFRAELDVVIDEALGSRQEVPIEEVRLLLYGAAIVGAAGFALAAELGRHDRGELRAMAGDAMNTWVDAAA
jgi:hypothetical protein